MMKTISKGDRIGYLFILPALVFMSALMFYPIIYNFVISMQKVDVMTLLNPHKQFIWFDNYINIFKSKVLINAIVKSFTFTIGCIIFQFSFGFLLAVLFNRENKVFKFMRAVMLVPYILPATVSAIVFKFIFSVNGGIANEFLQTIGLIDKPVEWLLHPETAMLSVIIANIWCGVPFNMILLSAGLANIPKDLYESAEIDGANAFQKFFAITVPSLKSSIEAVLVLGFVYTFRVFEIVYVMTNGGPVNGTEIMAILSYKTSFINFNFAEGAAISNILFLILFIVGIFYSKMIKKDEVM
ncbi:sugar ABC transporter permease [Neobacillus drentensis]|uniref:carbohydrate ABC transporter permease n=1 Tax=Neobacillus drentensis TaxID=220684 RepID=UPI001F205F64|nr:sugar ABC transporter permease [Neobacillus drentensis]ULT59522.1 sugar ABC transporter permease [Neobacillus drentensis]